MNPSRPTLSLVASGSPDVERERLQAAHDGIHRKYMGLRSQLQATREKARRLEIELAQRASDHAKIKSALVAYRAAFSVIAGAQESKRRDAGMESSDEILRLAAGIADAEQFAEWLNEVESLTTEIQEQGR